MYTTRSTSLCFWCLTWNIQIKVIQNMKYKFQSWFKTMLWFCSNKWMFGTLDGDALIKDNMGVTRQTCLSQTETAMLFSLGWHMSKGVTTPTVRVYQVHRGRDDRLKNKKSEDFPENRLVVQVAKPHWLQSGEHLTNLEICGLCLRTFVTDDETVQVERQQIIQCTKVWQSLRNFNFLFPHVGPTWKTRKSRVRVMATTVPRQRKMLLLKQLLWWYYV